MFHMLHASSRIFTLNDVEIIWNTLHVSLKVPFISMKLLSCSFMSCVFVFSSWSQHTTERLGHLQHFARLQVSNLKVWCLRSFVDYAVNICTHEDSRFLHLLAQDSLTPTFAALYDLHVLSVIVPRFGHNGICVRVKNLDQAWNNQAWNNQAWLS